MSATDVRPFSNGSEAEYWRAANCDRCRLNTYRNEGDVSCPMEEAVAMGFIVGTVPAQLAEEYGATVRGEYCDMPKQCPKFVPPTTCEYITHPRRRAKPVCKAPATSEVEIRGYRRAVCARHAKAVGVSSAERTEGEAT